MPVHAIQAGGDTWALTEAETIALAYYRHHRQDGWAALVHAVEDALADLDRAGTALREQGRQVSHGYVRGTRNELGRRHQPT